MEHATHLDVARCFLWVVIARNEVATLVALLELRLGREGLDGDGLWGNRCEEGVGGTHRRNSGSSGSNNWGAVGEKERGLFICFTTEDAVVQS